MKNKELEQKIEKLDEHIEKLQDEIYSLHNDRHKLLLELNRSMDQDLLKLAQACLLEMNVDPDYGYGLQQDAKRPFGNSGHRALIDTLKAIEIHLSKDISEDEESEWLEYARLLWSELPTFIKRCKLLPEPEI